MAGETVSGPFDSAPQHAKRALGTPSPALVPRLGIAQGDTGGRKVVVGGTVFKDNDHIRN